MDKDNIVDLVTAIGGLVLTIIAIVIKENKD